MNVTREHRFFQFAECNVLLRKQNYFRPIKRTLLNIFIKQLLYLYRLQFYTAKLSLLFLCNKSKGLRSVASDLSTWICIFVTPHVPYHFFERMEANKFTPLTQSITFAVFELLTAITSMTL